MEFQKLRKELKDGIRHKLYIFHGNEQEVMRQYIHKVADGSHLFTCPDWVTVHSYLVVKPLLPSVRTFLLENDPSVLEVKFETLEDMLPPDTTLIIVFDKIDKRKKFFLDAQDVTVEFLRFTSEQLVGYIRSRLAISDKGALMLAEWCGNSVARIDNEIDKLKRLGEDITQDILMEMVSPEPEDAVFEMIDALAMKDLQRAYDLYEDLIQLGESPVKLISLMYTKFRQMFIVQSLNKMSDQEIATKTKLNKWVVPHIREVLGYFSLQQLMDALRATQKTEVQIKTGQIDADLGFHRLILEVGQDVAE